MKNRKKLKTALYASSAMWIVLASSFLLMKPVVEDTSPMRRILVLLLGLTFWCALLLAIVFQIRAVSHYHRICREEKLKYKGLIGVFRFFSNPIAIVADICLIASLIVGVVLLKHPTEKLYFYFIELFFLTLSMSMHCVWNGKMIRMIYSDKKREDR